MITERSTMNNPDHYRRLVARLFAAALLMASVGIALAGVHYVDVNSTNATPPYTSWAKAATNIQDAVDAAAAGDEIVVTNGSMPPAREPRMDSRSTVSRWTSH